MLRFIKNYLSDLRLEKVPFKYLIGDVRTESIQLIHTARSIDFYIFVDNERVYVGHYFPTTGRVLWKYRGYFEPIIYRIFKDFSDSYIREEIKKENEYQKWKYKDKNLIVKANKENNY